MLTVSGIEKVPVQQCTHKVDTQCHLTYVTEYIPSTEEVCSDNYRKNCYIELNKRSVKETQERCNYPRERVCSPGRPGDVVREVCQTQYETSCVTQFRDTTLVEEVTECQQDQCRTTNKKVVRPLPDTVCQKIPFEACAPDNCNYVAGAPQCQNVTQDVTVDSPEEVCDLQPQRMCKQVYRLVPKLAPKEMCEDYPREVCFTTLKNPRKVSTPLLTKWCFTPPSPPPPPPPSPPSSYSARNEFSDFPPRDQFRFSDNFPAENKFLVGNYSPENPPLPITNTIPFPGTSP